MQRNVPDRAIILDDEPLVGQSAAETIAAAEEAASVTTAFENKGKSK